MNLGINGVYKWGFKAEGEDSEQPGAEGKEAWGSIYLSIYLFIYLSIYLFIYLSIYLSNLGIYGVDKWGLEAEGEDSEQSGAEGKEAWGSIYLSIYLSIHLSMNLGIYGVDKWGFKAEGEDCEQPGAEGEEAWGSGQKTSGASESGGQQIHSRKGNLLIGTAIFNW